MGGRAKNLQNYVKTISPYSFQMQISFSRSPEATSNYSIGHRLKFWISSSESVQK
jgi:hypothetical protein